MTKFLGEFLLSAVTISAVPYSDVIVSTGMIIWALIGLVGMLTGLVSVGAVRRRSRPEVSAADASTVKTEPQATTGAHAEPIPQANLTQPA